jgi:hypothetical protein
MFTPETAQEPETDEFTHIAWLLAINEQVISDLDESYRSGTDVPPAKTIESRHLPVGKHLVPPSAIVEFRAMLIVHGDTLRGQLAQYRHVRTKPYVLGAPTTSTATNKGQSRGRRPKNAVSNANA